MAGADDFLPVLIYVVIQANPPNLISNLEYIQRFRMQSHMAAEFAYFFTQLVPSAILSDANMACQCKERHSKLSKLAHLVF